MSNAVYAQLARQAGLMKEMQVVANNLANASTTGYKSDRAIFTEFLSRTEAGASPLSMGSLGGHAFDLEQGGMRFTGGELDLAIQGDGFFALDTPRGQRLTRAGHFQLSQQGELIDDLGNKVLDPGGQPITIPEDATTIAIVGDGTISVDGQPFGQIGVVQPNGELQKDVDTQFIAEGGFAAIEEPRVLQGALEQSNVTPVLEVARMIEVQRAYEAGQSLIEKEDERVSKFISAVRNF
ncbi:flagellar hook-basal body complex protein [Henriciella aquimarina]|uniref:flagellar hook-basal body complex protein n=1 Tax=Henriciella aquimarina TaxID=545261 RepID=UPI0009FBA7B8|nr:flagellar hook-basal body complex protein [Henriciella aquimarina]